MRNIQYAVDQETGLVVSRVGSQVAWPVLQYQRIGQGGAFTQPFEYELEGFGVHEGLSGARLRWTRKVPVEVKNLHRAFWGMGPV